MCCLHTYLNVLLPLIIIIIIIIMLNSFV